jgi:hypothetical protein
MHTFLGAVLIVAVLAVIIVTGYFQSPLRRRRRR